MNYKIHYDRLCKRAQVRIVDGYTEKHHIIPVCLGGSNESDNLVQLTPEEHYVAHQLLVKINPKNPSLVYAAQMMSVSSVNHERNNKRYGWLKRRYLKICRARVGEKNPSFGKRWYHNPDTLQWGKFKETDIPVGWVSGRKPKPKPKPRQLKIKPQNAAASKKLVKLADERFEQRKEQFVNYILEGYSFSIALKLVGYKNYNLKAGAGVKAVALLEERNISRPLSPNRPPKATA